LAFKVAAVAAAYFVHTPLQGLLLLLLPSRAKEAAFCRWKLRLLLRQRQLLMRERRTAVDWVGKQRSLNPTPPSMRKERREVPADADADADRFAQQLISLPEHEEEEKEEEEEEEVGS
jgi:hypothetical protein